MKKTGFTLIELLIVVAIIAILAAIAVPNFLEAQTRSKVSRVRADMRTAATALESYYVDNNRYPFDEAYDTSTGLNDIGGWFFNFQVRLTTPIAYLSTVNLSDPFFPDTFEVDPGQPVTSFRYYNLGYDTGTGSGNWGDLVAASNNPLPQNGYVLKSYGPGKEDSGVEFLTFGADAVVDGLAGVDRLYDPTNGTVSFGDIARIAGTKVDGLANR